MSVDESGPRTPRPAPDPVIPVPVVPAPGPGPAASADASPARAGSQRAGSQRASSPVVGSAPGADSALRRVLARARDGKALDRDEAATLIRARV
jgi:hypothetical protein